MRAGCRCRPERPVRRVLLTVFGRRTQPLIRYEISDLVRVTDEPCPCGRPYRVIESVDGREEDIVHFAAAVAGMPSVPVHPNRFHEALEGLGVESWQVIQDESGVAIRLVGARAGEFCAAAESAVRAAIAASGARVPTVIARREAVLERGATGKAPLIIARKPPVRAASAI